MKPTRLTLTLALLAGLALSGGAQATLFDRGGGLIYDDVLDVTWLQDANYGAGSSYDNGLSTTDGSMSWANAVAWAANLSYYDSVRGVTYDDWRLPTVLDTGMPGCDFGYDGTDCGFNVQTYDAGIGTVYSELAYMYYVNLGNQGYADTSGVPQSGYGLVDDPLNPNDESLFANLKLYPYWSGTEYAPNANDAWHFGLATGDQGADGKDFAFNAWAVRSGDVAAPVPEPETYALLLAGLGVVGMAARRRRG